MSILNELLSNIDFDPESSLTIGALDGKTMILDIEGNLHELEELACQYDSRIEVISLDNHNRLTTALAHSFRIGEWVNKTIKIVLDTNQVIEATPDQKFLTPSGDWEAAKDLKFGSLLYAATYNPSMRYPSKSVAEVVHIREVNQQEKIPTYSFSLNKTSNLLVGYEIDNHKIHLTPAHAGISR